MARRLRVGVDIDEVLVDFVGAFRKEAEHVLGRSFQEEPGSWDFKNWGISAAEIHKVWERIKGIRNWFFMNTWAYPDVPRELPWLCENHEVYFITSRVETAGFPIQRQSAMQLDELGVNFPCVIANRNKGEIAAALGLDVFIDDKKENLEDVSEAVPTCKIVIRTQSHNEELDANERKNWLRVWSFTEFVDYVKELSNAK